MVSPRSSSWEWSQVLPTSALVIAMVSLADFFLQVPAVSNTQTSKKPGIDLNGRKFLLRIRKLQERILRQYINFRLAGINWQHAEQGETDASFDTCFSFASGKALWFLPEKLKPLFGFYFQR